MRAGAGPSMSLSAHCHLEHSQLLTIPRKAWIVKNLVSLNQRLNPAFELCPQDLQSPDSR